MPTVNENNSVSTGAPIKVTASVRQGNAADYNVGRQRVKRKFTLKIAMPVDIPGPAGANIIDFVNEDRTFSIPVECNEKQVRNIIHLSSGVLVSPGSNNLTCLGNMVVSGDEPY